MESSWKVAGIDVHKRMLAVVVTGAGREGEFHFERRKFGCGAAELRAVSEWLTGQEVKEAVMESTAQYWKPVWQALEDGAGCNSRRRTPIARRRDASGISPTPNGWCGGTLPES